ncbi:MAG: hypothetical protein ACOZEN_06810 [Thermodesulfobacteriota bacterium]
MAETTSTTIANLLPTLIGSSSEAFEKASNLRDTVSVYQMDNSTLGIPKLTTATVVSVSEGEMPGSGEAWTPGTATLTSAKYRVHTLMTDQAVNRAMKAGKFDLIEAYGRAAGRALSVKVDKLITALYSGFDAGGGSGSGTTLTSAVYSLGLTTLLGNAAPEPYTLVCHPLQVQYLLTDLHYTAPAGAVSPQDQQAAYLPPNIWGTRLVVTPNTVAISSLATYAAIYSKEAIALGIETEPHIEVERVQDTGFRFTASMEVAVIEVRGDGGYYFHVKAA